jgi:hypothetical protein
MNPQSQQVTVGASKPRGWEAFVPRCKVLLAARLIAEGTETPIFIAEQVGITTRALSSWRRKPAFIEVVAAYRERIDKVVMDSVRKLLAESKKKQSAWKRKRLSRRQA